MPAGGFTGTDAFTYTAADALGVSASALVVITVTASGHPVEVASYDTPGSANDLFLDGDRLYVADQSGGLRILDVSNLFAPSSLGAFATRGGAQGGRLGEACLRC